MVNTYPLPPITYCLDMPVPLDHRLAGLVSSINRLGDGGGDFPTNDRCGTGPPRRRKLLWPSSGPIAGHLGFPLQLGWRRLKRSFCARLAFSRSCSLGVEQQ